MKQILFFMMAALVFSGCGEEKEEEGNFFVDSDTDNYNDLGKILSLDSVHYYVFNHQISDDYVILKKRRDDKTIIWKTDMIRPDAITVDLGYGEEKELTFSNFRGLKFESEGLLFYEWKTPFDSRASSDYRVYTKISIYSINGVFMKHIDINRNSPAVSFVRWKEGKTILIERGTADNRYLIIDRSGNIAESKDNVTLMPSDDPLFVGNRKYITYSGTIIYICDLDKGTSSKSLQNFVSEQYPEESNKPIVDIKKVVVDDNIAIVTVQITFYSGEKQNNTIRIDLEDLKITMP